MSDTQVLHLNEVTVDQQAEDCKRVEECTCNVRDARAMAAVQVTMHRPADLGEEERMRRLQQAYSYILNLRPRGIAEAGEAGEPAQSKQDGRLGPDRA